MAKFVKDFEKLRDGMLREAHKKGLTDDYKFMSTLERYDNQVLTLKKLAEVINSEDTIVSKEYVKGRPNFYVHPAIKEYNNTSNSANRTMDTLLKILDSVPEVEAEDEFEKFAKMA